MILPDIMNLNGLPVAVTGANGFIGRALVASLCQNGAKVTALLRSRHGMDRLATMGAATRIAPLDSPAMAQALRGQAVLFHCAYDMRASGAANLAGFSALIGACEQAGLPRLIHASSAVVYDDWPNGTITESSPVSTLSGGPYRQAKIAMEARLWASSLQTAALQPTIVWGPGSAMWTNGPIAALRGGGIILPDPPGLCAAVHVLDVVQAALRAAMVPDLGHDRFLINGPGTPTWADLYRGYADLIGSGEVRLEPHASLFARIGTPPPAAAQDDNDQPSVAARISAALRRAIGNQAFETATARLRALRPSRGPKEPDPWSLALFSARPVILSTHAKTRLGYQPMFTLPAGLADLAGQL